MKKIEACHTIFFQHYNKNSEKYIITRMIMTFKQQIFLHYPFGSI